MIHSFLDALDTLTDSQFETLCRVSDEYFENDSYEADSGLIEGDLDAYNADMKRLAADYGDCYLCLLAN